MVRSHHQRIAMRTIDAEIVILVTAVFHHLNVRQLSYFWEREKRSDNCISTYMQQHCERRWQKFCGFFVTSLNVALYLLLMVERKGQHRIFDEHSEKLQLHFRGIALMTGLK